MFDTTAEIHFPARLASTGGKPQEIAVRWPSDDEWAAYLRSKKFSVRQLGRGASETIAPPPGESDVALYEKIALNGAPEMTPAEAAKVLDALSVCQVQAVTLNGLEATVEMRVLGGMIVHHRLKIPSAEQVHQYKRSAIRRIDLPHNQQHATFNQQIAADIYDQCGGNSVDYASGIPMPHKHEAARAVIDEIELEYGPKDDASF
jgi:hypothetical protein